MDFLFFSPFPLPTAKHRSRLKTFAFNKTLITAAMSLKYRVEKPPQVCLFIHSFNSCQKKYDLFILIAYLFIYFNLLLKMQLFLYIIIFKKMSLLSFTLTFCEKRTRVRQMKRSLSLVLLFIILHCFQVSLQLKVKHSVMQFLAFYVTLLRISFDSPIKIIIIF